jgi:uncharacterized membrane protein YhaH (DUF805 family)
MGIILLGARIGAGTYLLAVSSAVNIWCLAFMAIYYFGIAPHALSKDTFDYMMWALGAAFAASFFYLTRRRLQDLNCPGMLANVLALPIFGVIFLPLLCFLSAPRFTNKFGKPPLPSGPLKVTAALASFVLALILVPWVARLYAPLHMHGD